MGVLDEYKGLADEMDDVHPAARTWGLSAKLTNAEQSVVSAVTSEMTNGNKSEAVRILIKAGWEAIEDDGAFDFVVAARDEIYRILDLGEDL